MITAYNFTVTERFLRYVQIDTQSDPAAACFPSTAKQLKLAELLVQELQAMGLTDAYSDTNGYTYATIPSNINYDVPVVCFCSHIDTAPDCSGTGVKPLLHKSYTGAPIILPDDNSQVITTEAYPHLKNHIGKSIITASGTTLLGADDKSGVAIIMDMAHFLITHPAIKHGDIKILFTPDEEVGRGTEKLDLSKVGAHFGFTLDGGEVGTFEDETFSADAATIVIDGVSAHPGYAKGKMINAIKIAAEIVAALPKDSWCPEATGGREGFVHPVDINGIQEKATIDFIVRDFDTAMLAVHEKKLFDIAQNVVSKYQGATITCSVTEQYRNMKEIIDQHPHITSLAKAAYEKAGLTLVKEPIRGGTDGSRLSFMGLPCPNIFTGMQAIHSKHEWVGVTDMEKSVEVLVNICNLNTNSFNEK
ncbi:MAG: peptidase T [Bacteroidetes bacterium]|nr:peptidase T [Bacteroidota bacterium]